MSTIADIEQEARDLCDANTVSYPAPTMLRRVNYAYEQVIGWIINADGRWQWDDTNYTNFPIGTYTLVADQSKYSFNDKFLQLEEVQILNKDGIYEIIDPVDQKQEESYQPLSERYATSGKPFLYDKVTDDTIELFPAPDNGVSVTLAAGLKIKFKRTADLYTSGQVTVGSKEPGFASPFHVILSYMAAIPYCMTYKQDRVALYEKRVEELKKGILSHYAHRSKDERVIMTPRIIRYI
jgi:hypothetical protein